MTLLNNIKVHAGASAAVQVGGVARRWLCAVWCMVWLSPPVPGAGPSAGVFAYAAAQVKAAMDATVRLGGANYVFWCGLPRTGLCLACLSITST